MFLFSFWPTSLFWQTRITVANTKPFKMSCEFSTIAEACPLSRHFILASKDMLWNRICNR